MVYPVAQPRRMGCGEAEYGDGLEVVLAGELHLAGRVELRGVVTELGACYSGGNGAEAHVVEDVEGFDRELEALLTIDLEGLAKAVIVGDITVFTKLVALTDVTRIGVTEGSRALSDGRTLEGRLILRGGAGDEAVSSGGERRDLNRVARLVEVGTEVAGVGSAPREPAAVVDSAAQLPAADDAVHNIAGIAEEVLAATEGKVEVVVCCDRVAGIKV